MIPSKRIPLLLISAFTFLLFCTYATVKVIDFTRRTLLVASSKEIEHALLMYYSNNGSWPPQIGPHDNESINMSWRTFILPYMSMSSDDVIFSDNTSLIAYNMYDKSRDWEDPVNKHAVNYWKFNSGSSVANLIKEMQVYVIETTCFLGGETSNEVLFAIIYRADGVVDDWSNPSDRISCCDNKTITLSDGRTFTADIVYTFSVRKPN